MSTTISPTPEGGGMISPVLSLMGEAMVRRATGQRPGLWVRQEREEQQR